jgi:rhomboid protease GluP
MNLFAELRFGLYIERRIGVWRVVLIYLVGTVGGELLSGIWTRPLVSVGASAALMALMGAHFVELLCTWHSTNPLERKVALGQVVVWIVITLCLSALPIVDAGAHIGGLVTGALLGVALFARLTTTLSPRATNADDGRRRGERGGVLCDDVCRALCRRRRRCCANAG